MNPDELQIRDANAARFHPSHPETTKNATPWEVSDETMEALSRLIVGRTIVSVEREQSGRESFPQGANAVTITLDNGSMLHFDGWGYDAWGLATSYSPAPWAERRGDRL